MLVFIICDISLKNAVDRIAVVIFFQEHLFYFMQERQIKHFFHNAYLEG